MDTELIVISDLHLSDGYDERTKKYSRHEDFFFDHEFERFLRHLQYLNRHHKRYFNLVIAGDLFDFLQVDPDGRKLKEYLGKQSAQASLRSIVTKKEYEFGLGTEEVKTVWKLVEVIAKGHNVLFQTLANFLSKGNRLSIITGNHDIELYWPGVQHALIECIFNSNRDATTKEEIEQSIEFYPWFYYDEDHKVYIEHGNQYDSLNSFQYFLYPVLQPESTETALWLPFGSFFVRYFFNKLELINPFADNIKPPTRYMRWALKEDWLQFAKNIFRYGMTLIGQFIKGGKLSGDKKKLLERENRKKHDDLADKCSLPRVAVEEIYSFKAPPYTRRRFFNIFTYSACSFAVVATIMFLAIYMLYWKYSTKLLPDRLYKSLYSFFVMVFPVIGWVGKRLQRDPIRKNLMNILKRIQEGSSGLIAHIAKWISKFFQARYVEKACQIKTCLKKHDKGVHSIIFGHTHDPDIRFIGKAEKGEECWYFNTGTWTTVFSEEERIIREEKQFTFVWITKDKAELWRWNDCLKQPVNMILFESER